MTFFPAAASSAAITPPPAPDPTTTASASIGSAPDASSGATWCGSAGAVPGAGKPMVRQNGLVPVSSTMEYENASAIVRSACTPCRASGDDAATASSTPSRCSTGVSAKPSWSSASASISRPPARAGSMLVSAISMATAAPASLPVRA